MSTFLQQVIEKITETHGTELHKVCLVTPNRRASLFLAKHLSSLAKKPMWAPDNMSMEEFVGRITNITIQEPIELLLDFYSIYLKIEKEQPDPLEEFIKWGPLLLRDFNDIDSHVPEPEKIFANILDAKTLETWNPDGSPPSDFQNRYLQFINKTGIYQKEFLRYLNGKGVAYQGLAYRRAADTIQEGNIVLPWEYVYFTGFNALTEAEEIIIRTLEKRGIAKRFVDADTFYLHNPDHEAGIFLRKYYKSSPQNQIDFVGNHFKNSPKKINIYGIAKIVNQAKLAGNLLAKLPQQAITDNQTAVVLINEELLLPLLNSIPENIDRFNVTMGYPLRKTNLYGLIDSFFQIHLTALRMGTSRQDKGSAFYYKDITRLLNHPLTALLIEGSNCNIATITNKIFKTNRPFLAWQTVCKLSSDAEVLNSNLGFLFNPLSNSPATSLATLIELTNRINKELKGRMLIKEPSKANYAVGQIDFEAIEPLMKILRKLEVLIQNHPGITNIKEVFMLFQAMVRETKVPLSGEPLEGLQIMGMLETQNLDFKNLILVSANEDLLPAAKTNTSLIPFDIRAGFGIPVYRDKDAIYAYHFYRLLQRADNIHIIYNTQSNDLGSSEKSRFITQLQLEMPLWNPDITIHESIVTFPLTNYQFNHEISIHKNEEIIARLERINEKGFSPSTLIQFIKCPLLFYFRQIAGIAEGDTLEETIEVKTLGIVIHETLSQLYNQECTANMEITPEQIRKMEPYVDEAIKASFFNNYKDGDISTGKNLLLYNVATIYVNNFLKWERNYLKKLSTTTEKVYYIHSEKELKASIEIGPGPISKKINFRGIADRIDKQGNAIRIIDYKTGVVDENQDLKILEWEEVIGNEKKGKGFQLLMYAFLYSNANVNSDHLIPGIFSLRKISGGLLTLNLPGGNKYVTKDFLAEFESQLRTLMGNIFDRATPFLRTEKIETCANCDFAVVCNRQ